MRRRFLCVGVGVLLFLVSAVSYAWMVPITVKGDSLGYSITQPLYFGAISGATNGFDNGIDSAAPPVPPAGFYSAFYIGGTVGYLYKDMRDSTATSIIWQLRTKNADGIIDSISWSPADIPTTGTFLFDTAGLNLNMRTESLAVYTGDKTLYIKYTLTYSDVGPVTLISPPTTVTQNTTYPCSVSVANFGNTTASFPCSAKIETWSAGASVTNLAPGDTIVVYFGDYTVPAGGYPSATFCAFTYLTGDENIINDSLCGTIGVEERTDKIPTAYELLPSIPNPATNSVRIPYAIPRKGHVEIKVYNIAGELVRTLRSGEEEPGYKVAIWDMKDANGKNIPAGTYFYKMQAGEFSSIKKMTVAK